jgi:hypothetical protein
MPDQQNPGEKAVFISPPTGGLNLYDNPLALDPHFASEYVNFMPPTGSGIMVRPAIRVVKEVEGVAKCMYSYITPSSTVYTGNPLDVKFGSAAIETLLIKMQTPNKVNFMYEINPYANPPSVKKIGELINSEFTSDSLMFMDSLYFLTGNASESPYIYNAVHGLKNMLWQSPRKPSEDPKEPVKIMTGELINTVNAMTLYKNVIYGSQKGTLNVFYILARNADPNSVANYADEDFLGAYKLVSMGWFSLMGVLTRGGDILKMFTFGSGKQGQEQDLLCIITNKGELLVYDGDIPNNLDTWKLMGHYYIPAPININCISPVEDDYIIVTGNGFVSLKSILSGSPGKLDDALSNRLSTLFGEYQFKLPTFTQQMFLQYYPKRRVMVFNLPIDMPLALSSVIEGYSLDQNTVFTFGNEASTLDYIHAIKTFLAFYVFHLGVSYTVDYFLDTTRTNKIEIFFKLKNLVLGELNRVAVDCEITMGVTLGDRYIPWVDPVTFHCNDILVTPELITDTITLTEGRVGWSTSLINAAVDMNHEQVGMVYTPLDPQASGNYEYDVTDVLATTEQMEILSSVSLVQLMLLPTATQNLFFNRNFRVGFFPKYWDSSGAPSLSILSLVDFPDVSTNINYAGMVVDSTTLGLDLLDMGALVASWADEDLHSVQLIFKNKAGEENPILNLDTAQRQSVVIATVCDQQKNPSTIYPWLYNASRTSLLTQWKWNQTPVNGYFYELQNIRQPLYPKCIEYETTTGYVSKDMHIIEKELLDRILVSIPNIYNFTSKEITDFLQLWFTPCKSSVYQNKYIRVGFLTATAAIEEQFPHRGKYWGSDKTIMQIIENIFRRYEVFPATGEPHMSLPPESFRSVYAKANLSMGHTVLGEHVIDEPIRLEVYFLSSSYQGGTAFPNSDLFRVFFVLYIGEYALHPYDPADKDPNDLTNFLVKPRYCATCEYNVYYGTGYMSQPNPAIYGTVQDRQFTEVVSEDYSYSQTLTDMVWQELSFNVHPNPLFTQTTQADADGIFFGLKTGNMLTAKSADKRLWIQQFGWLYSTFVYVNTDSPVTDIAKNKSISNTSKDIVPFLNMINTEKKYTSTQYVLDIQRGTWAQWKDVNMVTAVEHNSEFYFVRQKEELDAEIGAYKIKTSQICVFDSEQDGDFEGEDMKPIEAYYKTGFTDLGAPNLKKFTKCKVFATASTFWTEYPYDLYYSIDFEDQTPVRYSGETIEAHLRKPMSLKAKPKMGRQLTHNEFRSKKKYLEAYADLSKNVKWVNIMTIATQGTRIALGSRFYITEHNVIVWGYEVHFVPLSSY